MSFHAKSLSLCLFAVATSLFAGDASPRGHWSGTIDTPNRQMKVEVYLDKPGKDWIGTLSVPEQNLPGITVDQIVVDAEKLSFRVKGVPGAEPVVSGAVSADGQSITASLSTPQGAFPVKLTRTGDPKIEMTKPNLPVAAAFTGSWNGTVEAGGQTMRLNLKLSNSGDTSSAVMTSIDQGNAQISVDTIEQKDNTLTLKIRMVGGEYTGEINADGTLIKGTWKQGAGAQPCDFKKAS